MSRVTRKLFAQETRHIRDAETDNCGPEPTHSSSGQSFFFHERISSGPQRQKFQYFVTQNHSLHHSLAEFVELSKARNVETSLPENDIGPSPWAYLCDLY